MFGHKWGSHQEYVLSDSVAVVFKCRPWLHDTFLVTYCKAKNGGKINRSKTTVPLNRFEFPKIIGVLFNRANI